MALSRHLLTYSLLSLFLIFIAAGAHAQSVYLLQLGSFPSEQQANERWQSLLNKHPDLLSGLSLRIAQVALPPDNSIIYRTQAGPIENRGDASEVCQKLASTKDECFVVETAMFAGEDSAPVIVPPAASALPSAPPAENAQAEVETQEQSAPVQAAEIEPQNPPSPQIMRDESGRVIVPSAALMARSASNSQVATTNTVSRTSTGFLPNLQANQPAEPVAVATPEPETGTVTRPQDVLIAQNATAREMPPRDLMAPISEPAPTEAAEVVPPVQPIEVRAQEMDNQEVPQESPRVRPVRVQPVAQPIVNVADSSSAKVEVSEAVRVPLSSDVTPQPERRPRIETRPLGAGGFPSQSIRQKTLWVQISHFSSQQSALTFWDEYRFANRDISSGLRARITQPYFLARSGRVSLRVGPYNDPEQVRKLCAVAEEKELSCATVRDIGTSVAANSPRDRRVYRGYEERTRLQNWGMSSGAPANWVQLGSYNTPSQAWSEWERIRSNNEDLLGRMGADVNTANMSSSSAQIFRLRVGPFMTKIAARNLCDRLENRGLSCVTVSNR